MSVFPEQIEMNHGAVGFRLNHRSVLRPNSICKYSDNRSWDFMLSTDPNTSSIPLDKISVFPSLRKIISLFGRIFPSKFCQTIVFNSNIDADKYNFASLYSLQLAVSIKTCISLFTHWNILWWRRWKIWHLERKMAGWTQVPEEWQIFTF
jgi:hypothetical protein